MERSTTQLLPSYHLVSPEASSYVYSVGTIEFAKQLRLVGEICSRLTDECVVSFDDCHISQHRYAFPSLQHYGLRARFFAITGWIGKRRDFMTWQHLRELVAAGHEVQSHSFSHVPLARCEQTELISELSKSRSELEQKLGVSVDTISVPFGRWNSRVVEACAIAGYRRVYTSDPAAPVRMSGVDILGRFVVRRSTSLSQFRRVLACDERELRWLKARQRWTLLARALVGERAYFTLWAVLRSRKSPLAASQIAAQAGPR